MYVSMLDKIGPSAIEKHFIYTLAEKYPFCQFMKRDVDLVINHFSNIPIKMTYF